MSLHDEWPPINIIMLLGCVALHSTQYAYVLTDLVVYYAGLFSLYLFFLSALICLAFTLFPSRFLFWELWIIKLRKYNCEKLSHSNLLSPCGIMGNGATLVAVLEWHAHKKGIVGLLSKYPYLYLKVLANFTLLLLK